MDTTNSINSPFHALMINWDTLSQVEVGQKIEINGANVADGSGTVAISWGSNQSYTTYAIQSSFRSFNQYMYSTLADTTKTAQWLDAFSDKTVTYIETQLNQADSLKLFTLFQSMMNGCQALEKLKKTYQSEYDLKSAEALNSLSQKLKGKTALLQEKLIDKATQFYNSFSIEDMQQMSPWINNNIELIGFERARAKKINPQNQNKDKQSVNESESAIKDPASAPYKYFTSSDVFTEVTQKTWYRKDGAIDFSLGLFNSIANRVNRGRFDNDFTGAKKLISKELNASLSDFDEKAIDEINEFKQILINQLKHIKYNQNDTLNRRKAGEAKAKASVEQHAATYNDQTHNDQTHNDQTHNDQTHNDQTHNDQTQDYELVLQSGEYLGYKLYSYSSADWTQFDAQKYVSDREKFHISLTRDPANIARAFYCVAPILKKYKIASFKTLKLTHINNIGKNADGKELVIYIQNNENNQELWSLKILPEILRKFKSMNVQCGNPSKGDVPVAGGDGFIYTRSPYNCLGIYMAAEQLEKFGFSAFESANISRYPWLNIRINDAQPIQEKKIRLEAKHEIIKHVLPQQVNAVKEVFDQLFNDISFFQMIAGSEPGYLPCNHSTVDKLTNKYGTNIGNFYGDKVYTVIASAKLKREMFDHYFQVVALVTTQLRHYYGIETPVGNIRPALYEHFIKDHEAPINREKNIAIVRDLVLCALRNRAVVPAQPVQVDEKLLRDLIEEAIASLKIKF